MDIGKIVGRNIKTYLSYIDKEQKDLAEYVGVRPPSVTGWIKGVKSPRFDKVDKICEFLHCTREDLVREEVITFTEFKNVTARRELLDRIDAMNNDEIRAVLAFITTMEGINERGIN